MHKLIILIVVIFNLFPKCLAAKTNCNDIGIFSNTGKYFVLDNISLDTKDIGDLRWLGIYELNQFVSGSDLKHITISADFLYDNHKKTQIKTTTNFLLPKEWNSKYWSTTLKPLYHFEGRSYIRIPKSNLYATAKINHSSLATITLYDANKDKVEQFEEINTLPSWNPSFCKQGNNIFMAGRRNRVKIANNKVNVSDYPQGFSGDHLLASLENCNALMCEKSPHNETKFRVIDLTTNSLKAEFKSNSKTHTILFNDGNTLIQQQLNMIKLPYSNNTYKKEPTNKFRTINTANGNIIAEVALDKIYGKSTKLICPIVRPTLILKDKNAIHLLDIKTLSIVSSKRIPFETFFIL